MSEVDDSGAADGPEATVTRRGRGRPTDRSSADTRTAILDAAQRLFGSGGYRGVSMDAIARAAGFNSRAIYYHYGSKRELFEAASQEALARFAEEVAARVFVHADLRSRLGGYLDVYRALHATDPHLVPFIGMVLVDGLAEGPGRPPQALSSAGALLSGLLESLVDDAIAAGEVHRSLDRDGAVRLLVAIGTGLSMATLEQADDFPAALDALEMLVDGVLLR